MIPHLWVKRVPWSVALIAESLVLLGWLGISRYADLTGGGGRFLRQQVVWSLFATAVMVAVAIPNYRLLSRRSYVLFVAAVLLLVLVYFFPPINGAQAVDPARAAGLPALGTGQTGFRPGAGKVPHGSGAQPAPVGVLLPLGLALAPVLLILREPDLGTAMLFIPVLFWMLFVAGTRRRDLAWLALLAAVSLPLVWSQMSREQRSRVTAMFKQAGPGDPAGADTYQLRQAKQMMALGGAWGSLWTDPGVEDPAVYHLPEARSDFIFCVLVERLGLAGGAVVLWLYGVLVWRGLAIAAGTREPFGRLVAAGLTGMLAVQVVVNTAMTEGLLPVVGLSLPLVSYGGSGLMTQGALLGLILNVGLRPGYEVAGEPFRYVAQPPSAVRRAEVARSLRDRAMRARRVPPTFPAREPVPAGCCPGDLAGRSEQPDADDGLAGLGRHNDPARLHLPGERAVPGTDHPLAHDRPVFVVERDPQRRRLDWALPGPDVFAADVERHFEGLDAPAVTGETLKGLGPPTRLCVGERHVLLARGGRAVAH